MKKVKGSALIWCLAVLIVLSIVTLTAVGLSVSYYKSCMRRAGDSQADYNSEAAAAMLKDQLESRFFGKQVFFTYTGNDMLDMSNSARNLTITEDDTAYFGEGLTADSEDGKYIISLRNLENELIGEYIKNKDGKRKPITFSFNYGRVDQTVYNHGYYGDSAEIIVDSIEGVDENGDGNNDYYIAVVKSVATINTGHKAAVGMQFRSKSVRIDGDMPVASVRMLDFGISREKVTDIDAETGDETEVLKYQRADGIKLSLSGDSCGSGPNAPEGPFIVIYGDSGYLSDEYADIGRYGFIRTDGYIAEDGEMTGMFVDEMSYIDNSAFKIADASDSSAAGIYVTNHAGVGFTEDFSEFREADAASHIFDSTNIFPKSAAECVEVCYELPEAVTAGDRTDNRSKRYFVTAGKMSSASLNCYYDGGADGREYSMSFEEYAILAEENSAAIGDTGFSDAYFDENEKIICCTVEDKSDTGREIILDDIDLNEDYTYFFRICQDTAISFSPQCYSKGKQINVFFQICDDTARGSYGIDLKLINPPECINFFAFDHYRSDGNKSEDICSAVPMSSCSNAKNVSVIINNDLDSLQNNGGNSLRINGWFSCNKLSITDETENEDGVVITPRNVTLNAVRPPRYIMICKKSTDGSSSENENKNYMWVFEKYVAANSDIS